LFLVVARAGGLAAAARIANSSAPTLGRRMAVLERNLGRALFVRRRDGYALTDAGKELLPLAEAVEVDALKIERWRISDASAPTVRIAAGAWTSAFIARHARTLADACSGAQIELVTGSGIADLLRREANIGLRNQRPDVIGLAGVRLARVAFAVYGAPSYLAERAAALDREWLKDARWIAFSPPGPKTPSALWLDALLARPPALRCRSAQEVLEAAASGFGLCVLPCFVGNAASTLARASENIDDLTHEQYLVTHDQDRHQRPIRRVVNALRTLIKSHRRLFEGEHVVSATAKRAD
jgi:DNA-binding transcriptional LysR family regulator